MLISGTISIRSNPNRFFNRATFEFLIPLMVEMQRGLTKMVMLDPAGLAAFKAEQAVSKKISE